MPTDVLGARADDPTGGAAHLADMVERAVEPRFTTKQDTVRSGLGLALAIARRVVEQHDGRLSLQADASGTTATVILPVTGPADDTTSRPQPPLPGG